MIDIIKQEYQRRIIEEGLTRIVKCVEELSDEQLWYKHNANTNSVGNIILHLSGNVTQYIMSGIDSQKDIRERPKEFELLSKISREKLISKIEETAVESNNIVQNIEASRMTKKVKVQGFDETVLSIVMHVIEHFSYHVGQITFYTKYINDIDTAYYGGLDLDVTA